MIGRGIRGRIGLLVAIILCLVPSGRALACGGDGGTGSDGPRFAHPVPGAIISAFGPRRHPLLGLVRQHNGIDYAAVVGEPVHAAAGGEVVHAGWMGEFGVAILLRHADGWETFYAHLARAAVRVGDCVKGGDIVGMVGTTGFSTGPALHFETRRHSAHVDPSTVVATAPRER